MECKETVQKCRNPEETTTCFGKIFFTWMIPIFRQGYKKELTEDDLYSTSNALRSNMLGDILEKEWKKQLKRGNTSLMKPLWTLFKTEFFLSLIIYLVFCLSIQVTQPLFLMQILKYYDPHEPSITTREANIYVGVLIAVTFINSIMGHQYLIKLQRLGLKIKVAACSVIYRKALKLSRSAMNETSTGQIVNLLSNDIRSFEMAMVRFGTLITTPTELIIDCFLLYWFCGYTGIIGIAFLIGFMPIQIYNGRVAAKYRLRTALKTDKRILLMNEIIAGIQVIKLYTWEKPFAKLVEIARKLEIKQIKISSILNAILNSYRMYMSRLSIFVCIMTYALTGNIPLAQYVFVITSFYNNLTSTISKQFPEAMQICGSAKISCDRISKFLLLEEIEVKPKMTVSKDAKNSITNGVYGIPDSSVEISMKNVSAKWNLSSPENTLSNINFKIGQSQLAAIIGPVGSGKSSMINLILNEMLITEGTSTVNGKISYASQEPWLFKGTLRQNILFGDEFNAKKYEKVIKVCALEKDLEMLPHGDYSIVGEKGVSLSGGQKARVNLARAIYKDADIYLLDDPLSAVDTHVGKQLFEECISKYLSNKCTILVTHQLQYLRTVDLICLMENGKMAASGTYQMLQALDTDFTHLMNVQPEEETEKIPEEKAPEEKVEKEKDAKKSQGPKDVKETVGSGSIGSNIYLEYLGAGGGCCMRIFVFLLFIGTQLFASGSDFFLTAWVNLEQTRGRYNTTAAKIGQEERSNATTTTEAPQNLTVGEHGFLDLNNYHRWFSTENCIAVFTILIALVVFVALLKSIIFFLYCLASASKLHNNMFSKLVKAPMLFFNTNPSGRILNRFSKDVGVIDEVLPSLLMDTIEIALQLIAVTIILTIINPWMIIPTIVLLILFYGYKHYFIRTSRSVKRLEGTTRSPVLSHINASLQGLTTIRAFQAQEVLIEEFDKHQDLNTSAFYLFVGCSRSFGLVLDVNSVAYVSIVTLVTYFTATLGGNVGLAITQAMGLTGRLQWGVRSLSETENQMTSVERILEYTQLESEEDSNIQPPRHWPEEGQIELKSVFLKYSREDYPILKNLDVRFAGKDKIGIVGRTGAGKSSMIQALFRLAYVEGSIIIDGVDAQNISLESLRSKISIIPQEPFLFSGSLRKNLDPFEEYDDNTLWSALEEVELKPAIEEAPEGLHFQVSEGGGNFSVGQRQLICLARAIIRQNKMLILDEATANVDPKTDELIQKTIRKKFEHCTVLTIAHRLHTIMDSDKVLVMDSGTIAEFGHPYILLQNLNGKFHSLVMESGKGTAEHLRQVAKEHYDKKKLAKS